jgi:hypothetical protein
MMDQVIELMYDESPTALLRWLDTAPEVVDTGVDGDSVAIWFRLEGGRRVYVMAPHPHLRPGRTEGLGARERVPAQGAEVAPLSAGPGGMLDDWLVRTRRSDAPEVTGRDRNEDTRTNQRDERRALVLDPLYFEFCYRAIEGALPIADQKEKKAEITAACDGSGSPSALGVPSSLYSEGDLVADQLRRIPAYRDVTVLRDQAADHTVISTWSEYDVVHVATHGSEAFWAFGALVGLPRGPLGDVWDPPPEPGLYMAASKAGKYGPARNVWAVDLTYVQNALPNGLDKTFVYADACHTQGGSGTPAPELVQFLSGGDAGTLGWTADVEWDISQFLSVAVYDLLSRGWTVSQALDSLRLRRSNFLNGSSGGSQSILDVNNLKYHGKKLRIFETPSLIDPASSVPGRPGRPLLDGAPVDPLINGALEDNRDDSLTVDVEVIAITEEQAPATMVHLELDGVPIGPSQPLDPNGVVGQNRYRVRFLLVPVGKDLQKDVDYELEAVVDLPEGGESRYAVRLRSEDCVVPTQGDYYGVLGGPRARTIDRLGREGFAKILGGSNPFGDWTLQIENRTQGRDLTMLVIFDGTPEVGSTVEVVGTGYEDIKFGGGLDRGDDRVSWYKGNAQISFTGVVPRPGKKYVWVCGDLTADLIGAKEPPPGSWTPIDVPGTFTGKFMAEWYPNR